MVDRPAGSYTAFSLPSYISVDEEVTIADIKPSEPITEAMVKELKKSHTMPFYAPTPAMSLAEGREHEDLSFSKTTINIESSDGGDGVTSPQLMIIYAEGDLNCAMYYMMDSIYEPFGQHAISTVFVEECIRDEFVDRLVDKLHELDIATFTHPHYQSTLKMLDKLCVKIITKPWVNTPRGFITPIIVCDFPQSELGPGTSGVVSLHTFQNNQQIIDMMLKDPQAYVSTSIWNELIEDLYQLVVGIKSCKVFNFNCNNVKMEHISHYLNLKENAAIVQNGYHYEIIQIDDVLKTVVFPVGAHAFKAVEKTEIDIPPISFLNE